jgi:PAS domain S-box-containing protein/putative nucleotidyltransferase with HDIG domain
MTDSPIARASDSFSRLANRLPEIIIRYDLQGRRTYVNEAYERATGNAASEIIGTTMDVGWTLDTPMSEYRAHLERTLQTGDMAQFPLQITTGSGRKLYQQATLLAERDEEGDIVGALAISHDITGLVEAQETLRTSEAKYRALFEGAGDGISVQELDENDLPGRFIEVNDALCQRLGYSRDELLERGPLDITHPDHRGGLQPTLLQLLREGTSLLESVHCSRDGRSVPVEVSARLLALKGKRLIFAIARDISERKRTEQEALRTNRYLRTLGRCNETLVHATDETELLQEMCRITVENGEFLLAWIGDLADDQRIRVAASYGANAERFLGEEITLSRARGDSPERPAVAAIEKISMQVVQDIAASDTPPEWRERALQHGFGSVISLPLQVDQEVIGSFTIYLAQAGGFDAQSTELLSDLANDIAYGIHTLRVRNEHEHHVARLQASMKSTIQALSSTVELRDPYTAGHQRRVAKLAAAVARRMGYDEEQVEGIYLAGVVHDVGKIAVPAEILSRPGRLTETEMRLIRTHSEAGFGILKPVDFPWPIADIVHQHHERLDGSGYPLGLEGPAILPEARILGLCDVLEAMTSHRPYRPAQALDEAIAELERQKETLFDAAVVDACVQVLRSGFEFD